MSDHFTPRMAWIVVRYNEVFYPTLSANKEAAQQRTAEMFGKNWEWLETHKYKAISIWMTKKTRTGAQR